MGARVTWAVVVGVFGGSLQPWQEAQVVYTLLELFLELLDVLACRPPRLQHEQQGGKNILELLPGVRRVPFFVGTKIRLVIDTGDCKWAAGTVGGNEVEWRRGRGEEELYVPPSCATRFGVGEGRTCRVLQSSQSGRQRRRGESGPRDSIGKRNPAVPTGAAPPTARVAPLRSAGASKWQTGRGGGGSRGDWPGRTRSKSSS